MKKIDDYPPKDAVNERDEGMSINDLYQDSIRRTLELGIENRRLEKQNEQLKKRVESLQQGALHAENKRLRTDVLNLRKLIDEIYSAMYQAGEL